MPAERQVLERAIREGAPAALAALLRSGPRFADAEDAVQEAVLIALEVWPRTGVPDRPVGWFVRVAQRRLIARHRSDTARVNREALAAAWSVPPPDPAASDDDSLALLFLCSHPDLTPTAAIPLTLRAVGGLTTREVASVLLANEATIGQRISRAKAVIARSGEPFARPSPDQIDARLPSVLQVIYLIFTGGHSAVGAADGPRVDAATRLDLSAEAIHLARRLHDQLPDVPEAAGLLALLLLTDARRLARTTADGELVPLDQQDRARWDRAMITEGVALLTDAFSHHRLGDYQLQAAIAAVHDQAPTSDRTDWPRLLALYDLLLRRNDSPIVELNRSIVVAHASGPEEALRELEPLASRLADHHRFHATLGYLHDLAGDRAAARIAYARAAGLAPNEPERRYLGRMAR